MSLRELARVSGYGSNHYRLTDLYAAKFNADSVKDLVTDDTVAAVFKQRKDKLTGDPIWIQAWHHFMELKKGQAFRCKITKTKRIKDISTGKWVWNTIWARHQKRYMSMKMELFHKAVLTWKPYLKWRTTYMLANPKLPHDWHVGSKRLYKEKCFCIDKEEAVRKCGCEVHLKMAELIAGLKRWRRTVNVKVKAAAAGEQPHTCVVRFCCSIKRNRSSFIIIIFYIMFTMSLTGLCGW